MTAFAEVAYLRYDFGIMYKSNDTSRRLILILLLILISATPFSAFAFVESGDYSSYNPAGFLAGVWHGLLAPYTLIVRWFADVEMYAVPNTGWFYDAGFLLGVGGSLPIGWIAAIISAVGMFL